MSPSPVAEHAPTSSTTYAEDPTMGPSPTLSSKKKKFKENYKRHQENILRVIDICCINNVRCISEYMYLGIDKSNL